MIEHMLGPHVLLMVILLTPQRENTQALKSNSHLHCRESALAVLMIPY